MTKPRQENIVIVRLRTSYWTDERGLHTKKSLIYLLRHCQGFNFFKEDTTFLTPQEVFTNITNLDQCKDGIYRVIPWNQSYDWETGFIDDYEYHLTPYNPQEPTQ